MADSFWTRLAKESAKSAAQNRRRRDREDASAARKHQAFLDKQRQESEREKKRIEREKEKIEVKKINDREKEDKKLQLLISRFKLEVEGKEIFCTEETAISAARKALSSSVGVADLARLFINGKEDEILGLAITEEFTKHVTEILTSNEGINGYSVYTRSKKGKSIISKLQSESKWSTSGKKMKKADIGNKNYVKEYLEEIIELEKQAKKIENERKKIEEFFKKIERTRSLLPDDIACLEKYHSDENITALSDLNKSNIYLEALEKKKALKKEVKKKFDSLVVSN